MKEPTEEAIEALLREEFVGPVPDGGFTDSVMARVPTSRARSSWPTLAGVGAGTAACWASLWSAPFTQTGWRDLASGYPTVAAVVLLSAMTGMAILAMAWSVAEADVEFR